LVQLVVNNIITKTLNNNWSFSARSLKGRRQRGGILLGTEPSIQVCKQGLAGNASEVEKGSLRFNLWNSDTLTSWDDVEIVTIRDAPLDLVANFFGASDVDGSRDFRRVRKKALLAHLLANLELVALSGQKGFNVTLSAFDGVHDDLADIALHVKRMGEVSLVILSVREGNSTD